MTLSAMVAQSTGRNWVRADRFGGWRKAFLCPRQPLPASTERVPFATAQSFPTAPLNGPGAFTELP
jgi:hypothetical protein